MRKEEGDMPFTNLLVEKAELIGTLTLNRPEKLNAMTPQLIAEFGEALAQIDLDLFSAFKRRRNNR